MMKRRNLRQTGKTSLLVRGLQHAKQQQFQTFFLDFQTLSAIPTLDELLQTLALNLCRQLRLDHTLVEQAWRGPLGVQQKFTYFLADHILEPADRPIVLALDEADSLLDTTFSQSFFGLVRSWHTQRSMEPEIWEKLNIVLVISTEPSLLIDDINQSPFNVGQTLAFDDLAAAQVAELNQRYHSPLSASELAGLMTLLNGHPYLVQVAFYELVHNGVSWADLLNRAASDEGPFNAHLKRIYWAIHQKPDLQRVLKNILRTGTHDDKMALLRLQKAGLIQGSGSAYRCRCELYERYLREKL